MNFLTFKISMNVVTAYNVLVCYYFESYIPKVL